MGDSTTGAVGYAPFYRRRWFVMTSGVLGLLLLFAVISEAGASSDLAVVNEQLSEAEAHNGSLRTELTESERRIAGLESELAEVRSVERDRAQKAVLSERAEMEQDYEKLVERLDRRKVKLDARAQSLKERAQTLDSREGEVAAREAAADDQSGAAVMSGGSDESAESDCHSSYEGPCVPIVSDVDCLGGSGDGPEYVGRVTVVGPDVYDLDRDGDGVGCD